MHIKLTLAAVALLTAAACTQEEAKAPEPATPPAPVEPARPEPVNGWREYPLRDGVIKTHQAEWKHEVIDVRVPSDDKGLEYKLQMNAGDTIVYSISYGALEHPGLMVVEFHGHTEKGADGTGDLMFFSKTSGVTEHGSFTAPWTGIHGWYLQNSSGKDVIARVEIAGFYMRTDQ